MGVFQKFLLYNKTKNKGVKMATLNAIIERAQTLSDNEQFEDAYNVLFAAYDMGKNNAEFLEKIALAAQTLEKSDEAQQYWEELIEVKPDSLIAYSELQDVYNVKDRYKYYLTRAKVKILNGQIPQAIPDYKKAIDNTQEQSLKNDAMVLMARAYEVTGKTMNAIDEYYKLAPFMNNADTYLKIAELYLNENDKFSAITALEQALEHYSEDDRVKEFLAKLYSETGNLEKAEQFAISEFLKIKIKLMQEKNEEAFMLLENVSNKQTSDYYKLLAEYYFNIQHWEECRAAIKNFAKFEPNHPLIYQMQSLVCERNNEMHDAHINRAKMYIAKGQNDIALHEYLLAHQIDSKNIQTIENIIQICESTGEKNTAQEFYEKILILDPKNQKALVKSGDFYSDLGEYNRASEFYSKAAEFSKSADVFLKAGKCFEKLKREGIAKEYYEKYLTKAPLGNAEVELIKIKVSKLSDKNSGGEDEGFLEKIINFFSKK
jgi:tetratricopeptide (TPR) repeat protein